MTREWYIQTWHRYWRFAEKHDAAVLYHVEEDGQLRVVNDELLGDGIRRHQEAGAFV